MPANMTGEWAARIRAGDARALARGATVVENGDPAAAELLRELAPHAGHARIAGITGPPGAGKSTLVDSIAVRLRARGQTVAILAVDPSSHVSGGAILGDRIRMQQHHADPGIFIRSLATRGAVGGLSEAAAGMARLMDAAGRDWVLIETVGAGQDEVEIARLAHVTVVVLVPGMGDDVQALKAGILESAQVIAINKSDLPGADRLERELEFALGLAAGPRPRIVRTVATTGEGVDELVAAIDAAPVLPAPAAARDAVAILLESLGPATPAVPALPVTPVRFPAMARSGSGPRHVAFRVPDLQASVERLRAAGAVLPAGPPAQSGGRVYLLLDSASGGAVLLELIQESGS